MNLEIDAMNTYKAFRENGQPVVVVVNGAKSRTLTEEASLEVINHATYGFEWGYYGSGPAQLALAILLDHTRNSGVATRHYQAFKRDFVGPASETGFTVTSRQIKIWLADRVRSLTVNPLVNHLETFIHPLPNPAGTP